MRTKNISSPVSLRLNSAIRPFLLLILVAALYMAYKLLAPFLNPIILAIVLAGLFHPLQRRLVRRFPERKSLCAMLMLVLVFLVIVLPFLLFLTALADQGLQLSASVKEWVQSGELQNLEQNTYVQDTLDWIEEKAPFIKLDEIDLQQQLVQGVRLVSESFLRYGAGMLGNLATFLTYFFVMMFILFYLMRDGVDMVKRIKHLSPLREEQENRIFSKISAVSRSVFLGSLLTALLQGLAGGIGLAIVGIPGLFWGTMMAFASLIPVVGTALIWIPTVGYLLLIGHWQSAIFFALWSAVVVGSIDNFLRPVFMRGPAGMSPFWIFMAILGGVQLFGLAGLLYGPLILGFAMIMLLIYEEEFHNFLVEKDHVATEKARRNRSKPSFCRPLVRNRKRGLQARALGRATASKPTTR